MTTPIATAPTARRTLKGTGSARRTLCIVSLLYVAIVCAQIVALASVVRTSQVRRIHAQAVMMGVE